MKIKANNFTIFWENKAIAYATQAELDVNAATYEVGSATSGPWRRYKVGAKTWTVSATHLLDVRAKATVGTDNYRNAFEMLKAGQMVSVAFGTISRAGAQEAKDQQLNNAVIYSGRVIVRRFTINAVKGQIVSCNFEAVGCGVLTETRNTNICVFGSGIFGNNKFA